jgi:hypothetical protein
MGLQLRVILRPLESVVSTASQRLLDGAVVDFEVLGPPPSLLTIDNPVPAKLTFSAKFFKSVRRDGGSETRELATVDGELRKSADGGITFGGPSDPSANGVVPVDPPPVDSESSADAPATDPNASTDTASDAPPERQSTPSPERFLRFAFAPEHFTGLNDTKKPASVRVLVDRNRFGYLEVSVALEVQGSGEADATENDVLDVLITDTNPPATCPCDDCNEIGPADFEPGTPPVNGSSSSGASTPTDDAELPVDVAPGDRRKAVGLAQVLLNDFIAQMRLGIVDYAPNGNADALHTRLDQLPTFVAVTCSFDADTQAAVSLFQAWEGTLPESGQLDGPSWTRLIQTTEQLKPFVGRESPAFAEVGGQPNLLAVPGLGAADPIVLASNSNSIPAPTVRCAKTYGKASDFTELCTLVRDAEVLLQTCSVKSPSETLGVIRGIYYGTLWSRDFKKESSVVRNTGFNVYASKSLQSPKDPRGCLLCHLFEALADSQDAIEGSRHFDFGHCIIGLEGRFNGTDSSIPGAGHSGLEAATWIGDLGGGAALLADARVAAPKTRARTRFVGTDFGGSINIEGDVAAYVVALDPSTTSQPSKPVFGSSSSPIADALQTYLKPGTSGGPEWDARSKNFLTMNGGTFTGNTLSNRASVISDMADKIEAFACYYLVNRLRQKGRLTSAHFEKAAKFLPNAAQEVATIFVDALQRNVLRPKNRLQAVTDPGPTGASSLSIRCQVALQSVKAMESTLRIKDDLRKRLGF